jgi:phenylpropionate dioxygenase-like ring-hydroxylating dioxygenase large terminal subunit
LLNETSVMNMYQTSGELVNSWYAAGLASSFQKEKTLKVELFEIPLVCWRKSDGSVVALLDKCNHRNAPLSEGKIVHDCVVCPYHGWTYDGSGQCVQIPSEGPHTERIPQKKVEYFPTREAHGLVWIWMGRDTAPDKEPFPMPMMIQEKWHSYYMVTHFENNVTDLVENFMDVPHTIYVHKGWFRDRKQIRIGATVERTADSVLVTYDQSNDSIGFNGRLVNPKKLPMKHTDNFYMPNNTRVDYIFGEEERGFIITSTCSPVKPFSTIVYTLITYKFGWLTPIARLGLNAYTRKVINQDVWIMKLHGENIRQLGQSDYRSTQCDTMHLYIESLRKAAEKGDRIPGPITKEIEFWV